MLTEGPSTPNAFGILGNGNCLRLDDLTGVEIPNNKSAIFMPSVLLILRLALFITVTGVKSNTWYMFGAGNLGMLQNVIMARASQLPTAMGIHLKVKDCFGSLKVMDVLVDLERLYPSVGPALLSTFIPSIMSSFSGRVWLFGRV